MYGVPNIEVETYPRSNMSNTMNKIVITPIYKYKSSTNSRHMDMESIDCPFAKLDLILAENKANRERIMQEVACIHAAASVGVCYEGGAV
jgi:hypothetical protein